MARERVSVTGVVRGVVNDLEMREANKADNQKTEAGSQCRL